MSVRQRLDDFRQALAIDSSVAAGTSEYVHFLTEMAGKVGLRSSIMSYTFKDVEFHNLYLGADFTWQREDGVIDYLFINPLDTENPGPFRAWSEMDEDPFDSMVKGSKLYGLGANSGKLNSLLQIKVLGELAMEQKKRIAILGTYGRSLRSYGVLKFLRENKAKIRNIVIGFPTSNQIVSTQAGRIRMRISLPFSESEKKIRLKHDEIENSSSQSQYFNSKTQEDSRSVWQRNAIVQSFEFLTNLPEQIVILDLEGGKDMSSEPRSTLLEFDLANNVEQPMSVKLRKLYAHIADLNSEFERATNTTYEPHSPQINFGRVTCDFDQIEIFGECVFPPGLQEEISDKWMQALREQITALGGDSKILSQRFPYMYEGPESLLGLTHSICKQQMPRSLAYTTEADLFKLAGYNPLIYGPGDLTQLFKANECVDLEALDKAEEFYRHLIVSKQND